MMKSVLFDLTTSQPSREGKFHGGGEYGKTAFYELCMHYLDRVRLSVCYNPDRFLDDWLINLIQEKQIPTYLVHNQAEIMETIDAQKFDTVYNPLMHVHEQKSPNATYRYIVTAHGLRFLEKPIDSTAPLYESSLKDKLRDKIKIMTEERYRQKQWSKYREDVFACDDVVMVSMHAMYTVRAAYPDYDPAHIHCFYSPEKHVEPVEGIDQVQPEQTILMLGGNRWIKNVYRGIMAADGLFSSNLLPGYTVKVVGGIPKSIEKKIQNKDRFQDLGYVSPDDLEKAYCACDVFFYPSLNEGFGYPPHEAMKYGKTCIISAASSLPEIYRDSVYYCNPYDIFEMQNRLLQATEHKIDTETVVASYARIAQRQKEDLARLCELIIQ